MNDVKIDPIDPVQGGSNENGVGADDAPSFEVPAKKPFIFAVDDDPAVLAAVVRDLRARFGDDYRVYHADSGVTGLAVLRNLETRGEHVALLVVDQRMPGMTGVEFLREAIRIFPDAKRVLLTAYADTDAAIRAINEVRLDHYLLKPWDPPEERLYPVLADLLDDWRARFRPAFEGVRILGHAWSSEGHSIRDFLTRNLVPFQWLDVETDPEAARLLTNLRGAETGLPAIVLPDGTHLERPSSLDIANRIGLHTRAAKEVYDLIIVGAGPAGLAASVYGASEGLKTLIVEREAPGGQAGLSASIENYLGFPVGLSGGDLARRAVAQARRFGAEILTPAEARALRTRNGYHTVALADGAEVTAPALLIATGVSYRWLDVPGAERLTGAGIYYGAALTEAIASQGRDVYVLGGGNSAGQAAVYLSRFARSVTILVRSPSLATSMSRYLVMQIEQTPNIVVRPQTSIVEVQGQTRLEALSIHDATSGAIEQVPTQALFVFIGAATHTDWLADTLVRDAQGYIVSGPDLLRDGARPSSWTLRRDPFWLESSVPGVFVAGDVRYRSIKRVASAVGEGSMAVQFVHQFLGGGMLRPRPRVRVAAAGDAAAPIAQMPESEAHGYAEAR